MKSSFLVLLFFIHCMVLGQTIQSVEFHGLKKTNSELLFKHLRLDEKTDFDSLAFAKDIQTLSNLGYFVTVQDSIETTEDGIVLHYICEEVISVLPLLTAGSISNNYYIKVGVQNLNLWGRGGVMKVAYQYQNGNSYFLGITVPYIFKSNFGVGIDAKDFSSIEPVVVNDIRQPYDYRNRSLQLIGFYEFKLFHRIYLKGLYQHETYQFQNRSEFPQFPTVRMNNGIGWRVLHEYANTNFFGSIMEGFRFTNYLQMLNLETNDSPFYQFVSETSFYHRLCNRDDLAFRFKFGLTSNNLGYFSPFTLDSYLNIRGVGYRIDRGTGQLVLNAEYRYVVRNSKFGCWQLVGFLDTGTWREPFGSNKDFLKKDNLKLFQGIGGRLYFAKLSDLVLRLDFGYNLMNVNQNGFVFGFGQYF